MSRLWPVLLLALSGCGPYVGPTAGMGWRWREEPTVGAASTVLDAPLDEALRRWGYGTRLPSCRDADVCVVLGDGSLHPNAGRQGDRCVAEVPERSVYWFVVAHELGHCYGLPHSDDPGSVMYGAASNANQDVTDEDRARLRTGG